MKPGLRWLAWLLPLAACVALYWPVLDTWYQQDDFAWLGLTAEVHSWRDLPRVLFQPMAQGTIRPWSERFTFLVSRALFDLNILPFRLWVFATMFANLLLVQAVARRLTGPPLASAAAALLWLVSPGLATPMSWASSYNQIQCAFVLLLAFFILLKYVESRRVVYWYAQLAVFVLGFGTLEIVVVYPAIAIAYCLLFSRRDLARSLWLLIPSALYTLVHFKVAPKPAAGVYAQHWDLSILRTYLFYWEAAFGSLPPTSHWGIPDRVWLWVFIFMALALALYVLWRLTKRDMTPLFGVAWFSAVLVPVLPLRDHFSEYYLAVPAIGIALILGAMAAQTRRAGWFAWAGFAAVAAAYVGLCWPVTRAVLVWRHGLGDINRALVFGVRDAMRSNPGKTILLSGARSEAFWFGIYDNPFRLLGNTPVKLVPGAEKSIDAHPELGEISPFIMPEGPARRLLLHNQAIVLDLSTPTPTDATSRYQEIARRQWQGGAVRSVNLGQPIYDDLLSGDWYQAEAGFRWMGRRAAVRMAGPAHAGERLRLAGECPSQQFSQGPLALTVTVNGKKAAILQILQKKPQFEFEAPFPPNTPTGVEVLVGLEVARTFKVAGDPRTLGITFGQLEVVNPITQK
ncbi:MAG: glycosyltransferase family 39 protein [Bryobacterales bacterium]|nr:glycosyltransferase family 39 protein [Bryobacterales bacterium]